MTPKDKAQQLLDLYMFHVEAFSSNQQEENAKQCALIAVDSVDEILDFIADCEKPVDDFYSWKQYWKQVKKEIELL